MADKRARKKASARDRRGSSHGRKRTGRSGRTRHSTGRTTAAARRLKGKGRKTRARKPAATRRAKAKTASKKRAPARKPARRPGGTGREETLSQTEATGRSVAGRTNPMPTRRSTGTAAGAGSTRRVPGLERARRQLREVEESVPTPPSSLDMNRGASAARSGRAEMREARRDHNETSPVLTGGDVDANWEDAYAVGDEAPGGDNPTPDQDRVDDIGKALGVEYQDNEELRASDKIADRDKKRWELDPASSEDYRDRD